MGIAMKKMAMILAGTMMMMELMSFFCGRGETASRTVEVATVQELVDAIASDTTIYLLPGVYDLTQYYALVNTEDSAWEATHPNVFFYGNSEMQVRGVENLKIMPVPSAETAPRIVSERGTARVLGFRDCHGLTLSGLIMGHELEEAGCEGSVLDFIACRDIMAQDMELYGCGTCGITAQDVASLRVAGSTIRDCTRGISEISKGHDVLFEDCHFLRNGLAYSGGNYELPVSESEIWLRRCLFEDNNGQLAPVVDGFTITLEDCALGEGEQAFADRYPGICKVITDGNEQSASSRRVSLSVEELALCFDKPAGSRGVITVKLIPGQAIGEQIQGIFGNTRIANEGHEGDVIGFATLENSSGELKMYLLGSYGKGVGRYRLHGWETVSPYYGLPCGLHVGRTYQEMLLMMGDPVQSVKDDAGDDIYLYTTPEGSRELSVTVNDGRVVRLRVTGEI